MRSAICYKMNVSRASEAACGSSYGRFCIFIKNMCLAILAFLKNCQTVHIRFLRFGSYGSYQFRTEPWEPNRATGSHFETEPNRGLHAWCNWVHPGGNLGCSGEAVDQKCPEQPDCLHTAFDSAVAPAKPHSKR